MTTRAELRATPTRRPLLRSLRFWLPMGIVLTLLVLAGAAAAIGLPLYDRAMAAKASLEKAMPLASTAADAVIAGDTETAQATAAQIASYTADARAQTDDGLWKSMEWVPVVGPNLQAVRVAAAVTDDLVRDALTPATTLSLDALKPQDGAIDLAGIADMQAVVAQANAAVKTASADIAAVDDNALIPQVSSAFDKLTGALDELRPVLGSADEVLSVLPAALGAEQPRHYLMIFQNNAESRGTGGNPAALVMINVDQGKISIGQQASSANFNNGRPDPVAGLTPETKALYGDKVARWISDATMTPDFTESAAIVRSWWGEVFGTPIDAVVSFDPVALSYLLKATGPAVVPNDPIEFNGRTLYPLEKPLTLTAENAVPFLLNEVYWKYEPVAQDAIFAASAKSVFEVLTAGNVEPKGLLDSLTRAIDEGRLMYQPATVEEAQLVAESKLSGKLPSTNDDATTMAVYVNDFTQSKLDYYVQLDVAAESTQCTAPDAPSFALTAMLTNTVTPEMAPELPRSVAPARYFEKGRVATNLVFYGPVGSKSATVTVDGKAQGRTSLPHLGRPAVMVPVYNDPGQQHTVTVEFRGTAGEYGPLEVRHTPMVREVPVALSAPGCD
ncbi:DUF4012 domain-containing protein [Microbacterium esteraromaticum]|uniref:DUF4012 domain-containing protein n=1 Tax=Microbacterium esteraromaticum TaxID=57043 RepID=UPI001C9604C0|nr:DUF4012 domain-containing protein [Microbacterium esteraromaticum]MBY6060317.1 DUF4012 domain-containing protein [Microbacterium esteraromaticum]